MQTELSGLDVKESEVKRKERNVARMKKLAVITWFTAQFGGMFWLVFDVFSWDVMEPASYFLGLAYTVGFSVYFSATARSPTYTTWVEQMQLRSRAKYSKKIGYNQSRHEEAKEELEKWMRLRNEIKLRR